MRLIRTGDFGCKASPSWENYQDPNEQRRSVSTLASGCETDDDHFNIVRCRAPCSSIRGVTQDKEKTVKIRVVAARQDAVTLSKFL